MGAKRTTQMYQRIVATLLLLRLRLLLLLLLLLLPSKAFALLTETFTLAKRPLGTYLEKR